MKSLEEDNQNSQALFFRGKNLLNAFFEGHSDSDESWQERGCNYLKLAKELGIEEAGDDMAFYCF